MDSDQDNSTAPSESTERQGLTPDDLAANAFKRDVDDDVTSSSLPMKKPKPHKRLIAWHQNLTRKQKIILLIILIAIVAAACAGAVWALKNQPGSLSSPQAVNNTSPKTEPSKLTGLEVSPDVNQRQVTGVMIENSPDARPQAGLRDAGVVYEAVAEGGITRFLALFQDTESKYIGPVRSVRPYYLDFLVPFDGAIAHVGGSPQALSQIKSQDIKDLDQFANPGAYERISSRFAPHNVYTSTAKLDEVEKSKKYTASDFTGFEHARKEQPAEKVTAKTISMNLSGPLYNVQFKYDAKSNSYKRYMAGQPHKDDKSGKQISPKVVIAIVMNRSQNGVYSVYKTTGSGKVSVYQNGTVIKGTWKKDSRKDQFTFLDSEKNPIEFVPGKKWITIVTPGGVAHKP